MDNTIRNNEKCFIGMPSCGYGYESAKSCFVACPSDDDYSLKVDVIKDLVEAKQYECHIALKKMDPGNFAFCTKICSRIIQSKFCIVLLDPSSKGKNKFPNSNVHLEYGMMISQNKFTIPLQNEKYDLSFNIFPLDTIKYNEGNFKSKITDAINNAIEFTERRQNKGQITAGPEIVTYYNILGFQMTDIKDTFYSLLYRFGQSLGFYLFDSRNSLKYKFVAAFDNEDPKKAILNTKLLIDNIVSTYLNIISNIKENKETEISKFKYMIQDISVDIVISPFYDKKEVSEKINANVRKDFNYSISVFYRTDFEEFVTKEYSKIGDLKIIGKNITS